MKGSRAVIGVFDSGVGGLTVLRELQKQVRHADYLYFGDTARLPYGAKSAETVAKYAISAARFLQQQGAQYLVVACNTASALALEAVTSALRIPVLGVIDPGAEEAARVSKKKRAIVIATEGTVNSHAYRDALAARGILAEEKSCPLFVPLVEEGWTDHPVTEQVAEIYLAPIIRGGAAKMAEERSHEDAGPSLDPIWIPAANRRRFSDDDDWQPAQDVLVLGCTHYPLLKPLLHRVVPEQITIVDSAEATAARVAKVFPESDAASGSLRLFATDSTEKFRRAGEKFLGTKIGAVEQVALPE